MSAAGELDRLWAPHRVPHAPAGPSDAAAGRCAGCAPELVVRPGRLAYAALHPQPLAPGHLLVRPYRHVADYHLATVAETDEIADLTREAMRTLRAVSGPAGLNLGMNLGDVVGGAAHLEQHVVPRWPGDHNFMPVIGRTRTLPELLGDTRALLAERWRTPLRDPEQIPLAWDWPVGGHHPFDLEVPETLWVLRDNDWARAWPAGDWGPADGHHPDFPIPMGYRTLTVLERVVVVDAGAEAGRWQPSDVAARTDGLGESRWSAAPARRVSGRWAPTYDVAYAAAVALSHEHGPVMVGRLMSNENWH